jgi:hypothetical protein
MVIITKIMHKSAKNGLQSRRGMKIQLAKHGSRQSFRWKAKDINKTTAWSCSSPLHKFWLSY